MIEQFPAAKFLASASGYSNSFTFSIMLIGRFAGGRYLEILGWLLLIEGNITVRGLATSPSPRHSSH